MNQSQLKYARNRAEELLKAKESAITKKYTTEAISLSNDEKIEAILTGSFEVNKGDGWWYNRINFSETPRKIDTDKRNLEVNKLRAHFTKIMDELVLGDNIEALKMLQEFEAYV